MENILISACLIGSNCKYNGKNNLIENIDLLKEKYNLIPVCPEIMGGMQTPRNPVEINDNQLVDKFGNIYTDKFLKGADEVLLIAKLLNCKIAILKENSPSCGNNYIYDETFSGKKISGQGITTKKLLANGIKIISDDNIKILL